MPIENIELEDYYYPCWGCDIPIHSYASQPQLRPFCPDCKEEFTKNKEETLKQYINLKTKVMHERAIRFIEKQHANIAVYKEPAEVVLEFALSAPEKFGSSHEMMAAMELIRNEVKIKMQHKISKHRVDFFIPSMKVVLEVDGYMHATRTLKDSKRDVNILNELGKGWEVIRIPTKHLETNLKQLIPAIKAVYKEKQGLRRKNGGFIPSYYSKRESMHHEEL